MADNQETQQLIDTQNSQQNNARLSDQQQKQIDIGLLACGCICLAAIQGLLGYLFYYFATTPDLYGGDGCVQMRRFSYIFGAGCLIIAAVWMLCILIGLAGKSIDIIGGCSQTFQILCGVFNPILMLILYITLTFNEECGSLRTLVLVFFIITISLIVLSILFCCCICLFGGLSGVSTAPGENRQRQGGQQQQEQQQQQQSEEQQQQQCQE